MRFCENDIVTIKARVIYISNDDFLQLAPVGSQGSNIFIHATDVEPFELHFEHGDVVLHGQIGEEQETATVMGVADGMVWVKKADGTFDSWIQRQCNRVEVHPVGEVMAA